MVAVEDAAAVVAVTAGVAADTVVAVVVAVDTVAVVVDAAEIVVVVATAAIAETAGNDSGCLSITLSIGATPIPAGR